jgi:cardiolipin synthase
MWTKLPNILTFSRIAVIPVLCGLMYMQPPLGNWLAFSLYVYACVTDFFDGYLARIWQQQSALGRFLDPIADKILVGAIILVLADLDTVDGLTMLPAAVILLRELLVSGLREYLAHGQVGMPVTQLAKWKTVLQMLALGFLIVGTAGPDFGPVTTLEIGVYGLWISAVLTLVTGYGYLRSTLTHIDDEDKRPAVQRDAKQAKSPNLVRNVG